jgi:hypothetical protein
LNLSSYQEVMRLRYLLGPNLFNEIFKYLTGIRWVQVVGKSNGTRYQELRAMFG